MKSSKPWYEFNHLVFDIDGTLLNSNIARVWAWQDAIESENLFFPYLSLFLQMGLPAKQIIEKFSFQLQDKKIAQRILTTANEIYAFKYQNLVAPFDGVHELLSSLKTRKRKLYGVTVNSQPHTKLVLKTFRLEKYFDLVLTNEESSEQKPTAEPFTSLREILGTKADLLSFGDSPYDLKASQAAGIPFVYLGHGGFPREWFEQAQAKFFNINELLNTLPKLSKLREQKAA